MQTARFTLLLTSIECIHSTTENSRDDLFFDIYVDDVWFGQYFKSNTLKMEENNKDNGQRFLDITIDQLSAASRVRVFIWEKDDSSGDDRIGEFTVTRDDPIDGKKRVTQTTGDAKAIYDVSYRILSKPIPSLRVHGIKCEKSSAGCNVVVLNAVLAAASEAAAQASKAIGKVKTPKAIAVSKGFAAASKVIDVVAEFAEWIANAGEGDDDIYLQHVDKSHPGGDGGGFCPPSPAKNIKMNDGDEVAFSDALGVSYFRFPLDKGDVTIKIMDGDRSSADDCLGSLTVGASQYDRLLSEGAQVAVAADYISGSGQGAVYYLCYSVALEDWAKDPLPPTD